MSYFENYANRLAANGSSESGAVQEAAVDLVNQAFPNSPSYTVIRVDEQEVEVRIIHKDSNNKVILFRPHTIHPVGGVVSYKDKKWLITKLIDHDVYPKAEIRLCVESIRWRDSNNTIRQYDCVVQSVPYFNVSDNNFDMETPNGDMHLFVKNNEVTLGIKKGQRFVLGRHVYEVVGIDDIGQRGLVHLTLNQSTLRVTDDLETKLADNSGLKTGGDSLW